VLRRIAGVGGALRIVLVGTPEDVADFQAVLRATDPQGRHWQVVATGDVGTLVDPARLAAGGDVDEVILVAAESWKDGFLGRLLFDGSTLARPRVAVVPTVYDLLVGRLSSLQVADVPLIEVLKDPGDSVAWAVKALLDYVLALLLVLLAAPLCLLAMLAIVLTSPGPVLYRQERVGRRGRRFTIWKLRTMRVDAEAASGPALAEAADTRVIPIGRLLRAARLDEIPQLWNVLNGTMSLVGPRPERPEFADAYCRDIPGYGERWLVKPGLTGLAQVRGDYHTPPAYKLKYDLAYIYNYSLLLDLRILVETLKVLVTRRGV
jgi:exopolysaccharide biosynthesis polyprenyl glycosylphosphotransferase